jgi:propionate CoA-transferase
VRIVTADQAAELIRDDWTITTGGFGHCGAPEALFKAIEKRFLASGKPTRTTLFFASGPGDRAHRGIDRLAHAGLLRRIVGGFWSLAPRIGQLALDNAIEAHNWPQGVVSHMFRAVAAGRPGVFSDVGKGTFIDPDLGGGRLNPRTSEALVRHVEVGENTSLFYPAIPLNCALLRGTRADELGNISMEREANIQDVLAQAQAVRNSGGVVVVQVLEVAKAGALPLASVRIPGFLVDYVVVAPAQDHWQTYGEEFNPAYSGQWQGGLPAPHEADDSPLSAKRVVARRALMELQAAVAARRGTRPLVVNLGIGTPEYVAAEARRNGCMGGRDFTLTVESGAAGGFPAGGSSFGATVYPDALMTQAEQFDHYDGGGIDLAFLGFGQIDGAGRVNVATAGGRLNGVGGFVNIAQAAQRLVFCGTFTAGGLAVAVHADPNKLEIVSEGRTQKLVPELERVCFDPAGRARCKQALVITERAVLELGPGGLTLLEVAPGIDIGRDLAAQCGIELRIPQRVRPMPAAVFSDAPLAHPYES